MSWHLLPSDSSYCHCYPVLLYQETAVTVTCPGLLCQETVVTVTFPLVPRDCCYFDRYCDCCPLVPRNSSYCDLSWTLVPGDSAYCDCCPLVPGDSSNCDCCLGLVYEESCTEHPRMTSKEVYSMWWFSVSVLCIIILIKENWIMLWFCGQTIFRNFCFHFIFKLLCPFALFWAILLLCVFISWLNLHEKLLWDCFDIEYALCTKMSVHYLL